MIDIKDFNVSPSIEEIGEFIRNQLFQTFCADMAESYKAICKIEFSKCDWEYGWNVKFKKSGKSLCTIYPREGFFTVLVVVGKKEKEKVEQILPELSKEMQSIYHQTQEGNGQRWLMTDIEDEGSRYKDVLTLIRIRFENK